VSANVWFALLGMPGMLPLFAAIHTRIRLLRYWLSEKHPTSSTISDIAVPLSHFHRGLILGYAVGCDRNIQMNAVP
jgi:hypothetical protein